MTTSASRNARISDRIQRLQSVQARFENKWRQFSNARLTAGILVFLGYFLAAVYPRTPFTEITTLLLLPLFIFFVWRSRRIRNFQNHLRQLESFYQRCQDRRSGTGAETVFEAPIRKVNDPVAGDLNLLGPRGVFSLIDETFSDGGQNRLLSWMLVSEPRLESIQRRQTLIQKMRPQHWPLTRWLLIGQKSNPQISTSEVLGFLSVPFFQNREKKQLRMVLFIWLIAIAGIALSFYVDALSGYRVWIWLAYSAASLWYLGQASSSFGKALSVDTHFSKLAPLFITVRGWRDYSWTTELAPTLLNDSPIREIGNIRRAIHALGVQANPLLAIVVNLALPWSHFWALRVDSVHQRMRKKLERCFAEMNELEAMASLVIFHQYQSSVFPELSETVGFEVQQAFHPLIDRSHVVHNDFNFSNRERVVLITGSNMAGKSTFLRTIGVNQVFAMMGAPVFANRMRTFTAPVFTCIQISDSLRDGFSYFYSEVLRLKGLLQRVQSGAPTLFLVDEIFRGTNNRERFIGSQAVIEGLIGRQSLGFVSTHDLELAKMSDRFDEIANYHFQERIENGKMTFPYKILPGPATTTNALKIMKMEGLPVQPE